MSQPFDENTLNETVVPAETEAHSSAPNLDLTPAQKKLDACAGPGCPVLAAIDVIGGKWKLQIMWHLKGGPMRYGQLKKALTGVSEKMLIQQLRQLEKEGLVNRHMYPEVPPRVEYSLAEPAVKLGDVLKGLDEWSRTYLMPKLEERAKLQ